MIIETFTYTSTAGEVDCVQLTAGGSCGRSVIIVCDDGFGIGDYEEVAVMADDIPKLISALRAAYEIHTKLGQDDA